MKNYDHNSPIGVFDSGIGGLTVAAALMRRLPGEEIVYLGDTARVPYGNKSEEAICRFAAEDANFLLDRGVKLCIAACNTVSAVALDKLKNNITIGVIEAGVQAVLRTGARKVAVLATRATVKSDAYRRKIQSANPGIEVESMACSLLVPLAEEGICSGGIVQDILDMYLAGLKKNPPDAVLLGCTHYPLLRNAVDEYFSGKVQIIDSAESCAEFAAEYLTKNNLYRDKNAPAPQHSFYATDLPEEFGKQAARFLGYAPPTVRKAEL